VNCFFMYKDRKILALIPARGGSEGLLRKNIRDLLGKPLIGWTIEQLNCSRYPDRVVVSTDDEEIAEVSKRYGAEVPFIRPKELATSESPTVDTVFHSLDYFEDKGEVFDYVALVEPTSPLRKKEDIDSAIEKLIDNEDFADGLVSVGRVTLEHPIIVKRIDDNGYLRSFYQTEQAVTQRQQLDEAFFPYGVIYISKVKALRQHGSFYQPRTLPYFIERWQNYEVDDMYDLLCVEALLRCRLKQIV